MKKMTTMAMLALLAIACTKEETTTETEPQPTPPPAPQVNVDADAVLVALNTSSTTELPVVGTTTIITGTASASFFDGSGGSDLQDAGTVTCVGEELTKQNNAYFFQPSQANPQGLSFGSTVGWDIEGKGNVPVFNEVYSKGVPEIGSLTGTSSEISRDSDLSLGFDPSDANTDVSQADSIWFSVIDKNGKILSQTKAKTVTAVTFTSAEMQTLAEGVAYVQVAAFNYKIENYNGYKVAFINEGANTEVVTLK